MYKDAESGEVYKVFIDGLNNVHTGFAVTVATPDSIVKFYVDRVQWS